METTPKVNETTEDLALVSAEDLSLLPENIMNSHQLDFILKRTPKKYVHTRPARGGGEWQYVTGGYIRKCLNLMFGWNWDFEIISEQIVHDEVIVKGRLTCRSGDRSITKMQYGNKDIIYRKGTDKPLSIGNDMKAAATDCLKKCAAELGIAADIYNAMDFKEVRVDTNEIELKDLKQLAEEQKDNENISVEEWVNIERVINDEEKKSYTKIHKLLTEKSK